MKGRNYFTAIEAAAIKRLLTARGVAGQREAKRIRRRLRGLGFYLSDWPDLTNASDFDRLVGSGHINIAQQGTEPPPAEQPARVLPPSSRIPRSARTRRTRADRRQRGPGADPRVQEALRRYRESRAQDATRDVTPRSHGAAPSRGPSHHRGTRTPQELMGLAAVAGMHELKRRLERDVVRPLRHPEKYERYRVTIPNGILLYGPPGCGKTYVARRLAEELGCDFIQVGQSTVGSPYIHQTSLGIRQVFETAAQQSPAVLFIDEFEGLVPARSELGGHQQHKSEEVNEFLTHLDNCAEKGVLVIAATNEPWKIDKAVRRTGRPDKVFLVGPPDCAARAEMLRYHLADRPVDPGLDPDSLAEELEGYSASDIQTLVDDAAREAADRSELLGQAHLASARHSVPPSIGPEMIRNYESFGQRGL